MKVQIENNLYLESDGRQFIIKEYTGKHDKNGNETYKVHGYYSNINYALKKLFQMKLMESTHMTIGELVQHVQNIEQYIMSEFDAKALKQAVYAPL